MHYLKMRYSQFISKQKASKLNSRTTSSAGQFDMLGNSGKHDEETSIDSDLQDEIELSRKFDEQFLVKLLSVKSY